MGTYIRKYYERNRERLLRNRKKYYEENREKEIAAVKAREEYKKERANHWLKQLRETQEMLNQDEPNETEVEIW